MTTEAWNDLLEYLGYKPASPAERVAQVIQMVVKARAEGKITDEDLNLLIKCLIAPLVATQISEMVQDFFTVPNMMSLGKRSPHHSRGRSPNFSLAL
jgi:hypothetical protein